MSVFQAEVDRIFAKKVQIFGGSVDFQRESILNTILKISLKTMFECARLETFGKNGFQQMSVDCHALRCMLPIHLEDTSALGILLDEVGSSASDRCLDPSPMAPAVIDGLVGVKIDEWMRQEKENRRRAKAQSSQ